MSSPTSHQPTLGLLPPEKRWEVEFSTYFTQLPQGLSCAWRGVLRGTAEAKQALKLPNTFIVDLSAKNVVAEGGALVEWARTGKQPIRDPEQPTERLDQSASRSRSAGRATAEPGSQPTRETSARTRGVNVPCELIPSLQETARPRVEGRPKQPSKRSPGLRRWLVILASVATSAVFILSFYYYSFTRTPSQSITEPATKSLAAQKNKPDIASENKAPEQDKMPSAQPVAHKQKPPASEEGKGSKAEETMGGTAAIVRAAASEMKPAPAAPPLPANPVLEFFALPQLALSQLGGQEKATGKYPLSSDILRLSFLFPNNNIKDVTNNNTSRIIRTPTTSVLEDALELATFKVSTRGLDFEWSKHSMNKTQFLILSKLVRDTVLKVETVKGTSYLALRDCPILSAKAISLVHSGRQPAGYKPRNLTSPWANEEPLRDTLWRLGIQRWRVDAFSRKGERTTLCKGDFRDPPAEVNHEIEPGRIDFKVKLEKHNLHIHLDFEEGKILDEQKYWKELPDKKKRLDQKLVDTAKMTGDPEGTRKMEAEIRKQLEDLEKEKKDLNHKIRTYDLINDCAKAELSITIVMKLDNGFMLDLARIGEFATPAP